MNKGGKMKSKGYAAGGKLVRGIKGVKAGKKMKAKGMKRGGKMMSKGGATGGKRKMNGKKNMGLYGRK